jgi:hypothetical protein
VNGITAIIQWLFAHFINEAAVYREGPPQKNQKEKKEDDKRDHRPYLDVVNALQNFFVHSAFF